ncbi:MAG TPA: class II aldolase/adducin family protein [Saprospiraceae bacterium]|nr:class II aldolase/adducin family protein [Saprospiraceae bacterium]HMQ83646.1 class II aldolase/adducin family protein [Saprospiraceae bacterium]
MHDEEGYIKFQADWRKTAPLPVADWANIHLWRQKLYQLGLIGAYPDGIGFGNISQRTTADHQFVITGSATGNIPILDENHFTLVTAVDADANRLCCKGPIIASSESMSHAVLYQECPEIGGVIHVHHLALWEQLLHQIPTTDQQATYGSPEMAASILHLLRSTDLLEKRIFVMEGHREGLFTFGKDLDEAGEVLLAYFDAWKKRSLFMLGKN